MKIRRNKLSAPLKTTPEGGKPILTSDLPEKSNVVVEKNLKYKNGKTKKINNENPIGENVVTENKDVLDDETITWSEQDLSELIRRMEMIVPEKDNLVYSTRAGKLNWESVAFDNYTAKDCKHMWGLIQKRLRRFRILSEVLRDAKEWINRPWTNFYRGNKTKRHPDMPPRPLSAYMLFYLKKKDKILSENPGMDITLVSKKIALKYKTISREKREKYEKLAAQCREEYEKKLKEFFERHPNFQRCVDKNQQKSVETGPKKPQTPFGLYYLGQLKKIKSNDNIDKSAFKEQCKEQWKNMLDKKKVLWINWAEEEQAKYEDELKKYKTIHPEFVPTPLKPILTKEEKLLKERIAGKPVKPPNSAYSLYSRIMLQSEEIKAIAPKDRLNYIATQWKNYTDEEKKHYQERATHMMEQYKLDFATYLESLPEDKQLEELQNNLPKRKAKLNLEDLPTTKRKRKCVEKENKNCEKKHDSAE